MAKKNKSKKQVVSLTLAGSTLAAAGIALNPSPALANTSEAAQDSFDTNKLEESFKVQGLNQVESLAPTIAAQSTPAQKSRKKKSLEEAPAAENNTPTALSEPLNKAQEKLIWYTVNYVDIATGEIVYSKRKSVSLPEGQDVVTITEIGADIVNDVELANYCDESGQSLVRTVTARVGDTPVITYKLTKFGGEENKPKVRKKREGEAVAQPASSESSTPKTPGGESLGNLEPAPEGVLDKTSKQVKVNFKVYGQGYVKDYRYTIIADRVEGEEGKITFEAPPVVIDRPADAANIVKGYSRSKGGDVEFVPLKRVELEVGNAKEVSLDLYLQCDEMIAGNYKDPYNDYLALRFTNRNEEATLYLKRGQSYLNCFVFSNGEKLNIVPYDYYSSEGRYRDTDPIGLGSRISVGEEIRSYVGYHPLTALLYKVKLFDIYVNDNLYAQRIVESALAKTSSSDPNKEFVERVTSLRRVVEHSYPEDGGLSISSSYRMYDKYSGVWEFTSGSILDKNRYLITMSPGTLGKYGRKFNKYADAISYDGKEVGEVSWFGPQKEAPIFSTGVQYNSLNSLVLKESNFGNSSYGDLIPLGAAHEGSDGFVAGMRANAKSATLAPSDKIDPNLGTADPQAVTYTFKVKLLSGRSALTDPDEYVFEQRIRSYKTKEGYRIPKEELDKHAKLWKKQTNLHFLRWIYGRGNQNTPQSGYIDPETGDLVVYALSSNPNVEVSINALWGNSSPAPIVHTVEYIANNGTNQTKNTSNNRYDPNEELEGQTYVVEGNTFNAPEGKRFKGWSLSQFDADEGIVKPGLEARNLPASLPYERALTAPKTTRLYAVWEDDPTLIPVSYTVEHYKENLEGGYDKIPSEIDNLEAGNTTTAQAESKTYQGFSVDSTNSNAVMSGIVSDAEPLILKVYYRRNIHKYRFDAGLGTFDNGSSDWSFNKKFGAPVGKIPIPTRQGYTFMGWEDVEAQEAVPYIMGDRDMQFRAVWKEGEHPQQEYTFTIHFNNGGNTALVGSMPDMIISRFSTPDEAGRIEMKITLPESDFKHKGYVFYGWSTDRNAVNMIKHNLGAEVSDMAAGAEYTINFAGDLGNKEITLYPTFDDKRTDYAYTINFDTSGAEGVINSITEKLELKDLDHDGRLDTEIREIRLPKAEGVLTKPGYRFVGWEADKRYKKLSNNVSEPDPQPSSDVSDSSNSHARNEENLAGRTSFLSTEGVIAHSNKAIYLDEETIVLPFPPGDYVDHDPKQLNFKALWEKTQTEPGGENPGGTTPQPGTENPGGTTPQPGTENPGGTIPQPGTENPGGTTPQPEAGDKTGEDANKTIEDLKRQIEDLKQQIAQKPNPSQDESAALKKKIDDLNKLIEDLKAKLNNVEDGSEKDKLNDKVTEILREIETIKNQINPGTTPKPGGENPGGTTPQPEAGDKTGEDANALKVIYHENYPKFLVTGKHKIIGMPKTQAYDVRSGVKIASEAPELYGYSFEGWVDKDNLGHIYNSGFTYEFKNPGEVHLYALWQPRLVKIALDENYEGGKVSLVQFLFGQKVEISKMYSPEREGYIFKGWSRESGLSIDAAPRPLRSIPDTGLLQGDFRIDSIEPVVLYAIWEKDSKAQGENTDKDKDKTPEAEENNKPQPAGGDKNPEDKGDTQTQPEEGENPQSTDKQEQDKLIDNLEKKISDLQNKIKELIEEIKKVGPEYTPYEVENLTKKKDDIASDINSIKSDIAKISDDLVKERLENTLGQFELPEIPRANNPINDNLIDNQDEEDGDKRDEVTGKKPSGLTAPGSTNLDFIESHSALSAKGKASYSGKQIPGTGDDSLALESSLVALAGLGFASSTLLRSRNRRRKS